MRLANEIKVDIREAKKIRLPWWGLLCVGISSLLLCWLFDHLGRLDLVVPTLISILALGFAVAVKRKLTRYAWFWGTMAVLAAFHVALIVSVPWATQWVPALAIAAVGSADLIVVLAILGVVGNFMERPTRAGR
jgi:hypothetical protein